MVHVYVLRGLLNRKRYVGITANLDERLRTHARRATKGGQLLGSFELLLTEEFPDYSCARRREKFLKSGQGRIWLDLKFGSRVLDTAIDTTPSSATVSGPSSGV